MSLDISGKWNFNQEFEFGLDQGVATIFQEGETLSGFFEYVEKYEDNPPFSVRQDFIGSIHLNKIRITGTRAISPSGEILNDYNLDTLEGTYTHEGKIVGHSYDDEAVCGVFVLEKITE